jgi:hypothetical protein
MTCILKNNSLEVEIADPMEHYRASRFDHSGNILQVTLNKKHTFLTAEKKSLNPDFGFGLMNEFDIEEPCDYAETIPGKSFHKIGVGSLIKKNNGAYDFFNQYKNTPQVFNIENTSDKDIMYHSLSEMTNDIQLEYHKKISIEGSQLVIEYKLKNNGNKTIETSEYGHNFIALNHRPIGSDYQLSFNFALQPEIFKTVVDNEELLTFTASRLSWKATPENDFFIAEVNGNIEMARWWQITNTKEGIGIREDIDFECKQVNLWGTSHVVSPELFHHICLKPGEEAVWNRRYTFFEI